MLAASPAPHPASPPSTGERGNGRNAFGVPMFMFRSVPALHLTRRLALAAALAGGVLASSARAVDWPTNRGNPNHTGSVDNQPGPKAPKVRWAFKSKEHFIAAPVPAGNALYVSGLGFGNAAAFYALALDGDAPSRILWNKA